MIWQQVKSTIKIKLHNAMMSCSCLVLELSLSKFVWFNDIMEDNMITFLSLKCVCNSYYSDLIHSYKRIYDQTTVQKLVMIICFTFFTFEQKAIYEGLVKLH